MEQLLAVNNLSKFFYPSLFSFKNYYKAVDSISFELHSGEILGFLGPNGSGKTTTIQMLLSVMTPSEGTISYFGKDFAAHRSEILQHIGYATTYAKLPARLTIHENLVLYGKFYGLSRQVCDQRIKELLGYFGLWERRNQQTGGLSAGQMARVNLIRAFLHKPRIILLDEPTAALDPDIAQDLRKLILDLQQSENISILFTSHNMLEVAQICDRVIVLDRGKIIANDTPEILASTISLSRLTLMFGDGLYRTIAFASKQGFRSSMMGRSLTIELPEESVATFLQELAAQGIYYSTISLSKPTLEDYFLQLTKEVRL